MSVSIDLNDTETAGPGEKNGSVSRYAVIGPLGERSHSSILKASVSESEVR